jgi:hypothetical protein
MTYRPVPLDDRGKRSASLRAVLDQIVLGIDDNAKASSHNDAEFLFYRFQEQIKALYKLKAIGMLDQDQIDLMTAGNRSTYNCLERCRRNLPLELERIPMKGIPNGMLVMKPVEAD